MRKIWRSQTFLNEKILEDFKICFEKIDIIVLISKSRLTQSLLQFEYSTNIECSSFIANLWTVRAVSSILYLLSS